MLFWTIATLISLAVAALLARRMFTGGPEGEPAEAYDVGIYRDQLAEVERDLARGALPAEEADRVRTEVSRRLLAADAAARASGSAGPRRQGPRLAAAGLALAVTLGSLWLYYDLGVPGYGDMPRAGRIADAQEMLRDLPAQAELEANATPLDMEPAQPSEEFVQLMEQLRSAVAARPDDPRGQRLLARNEAALGNFAAAARAQAELLRLSGPSASGQDYADYADMLILAAGGQILRRGRHRPAAGAAAGSAQRHRQLLFRPDDGAHGAARHRLPPLGSPAEQLARRCPLGAADPRPDAPRRQSGRRGRLSLAPRSRPPWRRWSVPRRKTSTTPPNCPTKGARRWCAAWSGASASGWPTRAARPRNGHG